MHQQNDCTFVKILHVSSLAKNLKLGYIMCTLKWCGLLLGRYAVSEEQVYSDNSMGVASAFLFMMMMTINNHI